MLLLILLTAATPAPATEMLLPLVLTEAATLAAAARVLMLPSRFASRVTPPDCVTTLAFLTVAATLPLISLIATLAARVTANESPWPNEPAIEAAPTSAVISAAFRAFTEKLPASTETALPSAATHSAVVATSTALRAPDPPRLTVRAESVPLADTPTATVTVVAAIFAVDSARTPTAPVARTGVLETVARTAAPEPPMTLFATEAPTATPVALPSAAPARVIAAAPVRATILAASVAETSREPTLAPPFVASPTLESVISATVEPRIVFRASAPPPLTEVPLPCDETCAPTAAA